MVFQSFSRLPTELRTSIWELALAALPSREVELVGVPNYDEDFEADKIITTIFSDPLPSLVSVCRESHAIALQRYTRAFDCTWIDFRRDVVTTELIRSDALFSHSDILNVQNFKLSCGEDTDWRFLIDRIGQKLTSLRCIEFVMGDLDPVRDNIHTFNELQVERENVVFQLSQREGT